MEIIQNKTQDCKKWRNGTVETFVKTQNKTKQKNFKKEFLTLHYSHTLF